MPVLGIVASQISGHLWAPTGAYDSIATGTGTGSSGVISFTSIPSTYTHLQIRGIQRSTSGGASTTDMKMQFNGDTASNYSQHYMIGTGSSIPTGGQANYTYIVAGPGLLNGNTANVYTAVVIDILDYANTNIYKTARILTGWDANGSGEVGPESGSWRNTAAINRIDLTVYSGNLSSFTTFALYGIKGN